MPRGGPRIDVKRLGAPGGRARGPRRERPESTPGAARGQRPGAVVDICVVPREVSPRFWNQGKATCSRQAAKPQNERGGFGSASSAVAWVSARPHLNPLPQIFFAAFLRLCVNESPGQGDFEPCPSLSSVVNGLFILHNASSVVLCGQWLRAVCSLKGCGLGRLSGEPV